MALSKLPDLDLRTICSALGRVQTKWFKIGIQLGIPHNKLQEFEKESDPLSTVVNYWLKGNVTVPISWKTIVNALKSAHVGEPGLAEEISQEYYPQKNTTKNETASNSSDEATSSSDDKMDPGIREDLEFILKRNLRKISVTYSCYVNTIRRILTERGVTPDDFKADLLTLPAFSKSSKSQQLALLIDQESELKKSNTLAEIFTFLNKKCASFLDYEIFQDILNYYEIDQDQERLKYKEHLKSYANKHNVSEFVIVNPLLEKYTKNYEKLVLKFDVEQTCRLAEIKNLKSFIAEILDLNPSTLQIIDIQEGCVVVTFLIPTSVADIIFTSNTVFTPQQEDKLRANSVLWLECNGHTFDFRIKIPSESQDHVGAVGTSSQTKPQSGDVEKVRKKLAKVLFIETEYQDILVTPLHDAVESCDIDSVRKLLKGAEIALHKTVKPQLTDALSPQLLSDHEGSKLKQLGIFDKIIRNVRNLRTDATKLQNISATPLHRATESHELGKVREVLGQAEYSVNCVDSIGWTPLHYACATGNLDMVRMLISEFKADLTAEDGNGITALMLAALAGHDNVVLPLLSEYQCPDANAALLMACAGGHTSLMRTLLLDLSADTQAKFYGLSPLEMAAWCGEDEVALTLIREFDCNVKVKGQCGRSLLHQACIGGSANLVRTLIHECNVDVNARDDLSNTPLHMAALHSNTEVVQMLITDFQCDTKAKGYLDRSLLHQACIAGSVDLVRTLILEHKADINARDDEKNTPFHLAAECGNNDVAAMLLREFSCEQDKDDTSLHEELHDAAIHGKDKVVLALLNNSGCDTKVKDHFGRSLLHQACYGGSVNLVRTLIYEHHADINARDDNDNTPLDVAAFCGHDEVVVTLMTEFGCEPQH